MEIKQVAHLVSEEKLCIFMKKKTFLVKNIQAETQLSNDIQACQLIPTNLTQCWGFSVKFQEISIPVSRYHMGLAVQATPNSSQTWLHESLCRASSWRNHNHWTPTGA